jgi:8-oxo-dGTP pyrophosphatase MutT (NUDIX family)
MAPGWMPPAALVTQALGLCFTAEGQVVMVTWDGRQWTFPGGTVEDGETVEQALVREVAEEAGARVVACRFLAARQWTFPGGTVEDGETVEQALVREVAEEAGARVVACRFLAAHHVADPLNPNGGPSYYQTRWWARVELDPWQPQHEMIARRLVAVDQVLPTLCWSRKEVAGRLLDLALQVDRQHRTQ